MNPNSPSKVDLPAGSTQLTPLHPLLNTTSPSAQLSTTNPGTPMTPGVSGTNVTPSAMETPNASLYTATPTGTFPQTSTQAAGTNVPESAGAGGGSGAGGGAFIQSTAGTPTGPTSTAPTVEGNTPQDNTDDEGRGTRTNTEEADRIVLEYLRKRGFKSAEQAFLQQSSTSNPARIDGEKLALDDAQVDDDLRNVLMMLRDPAQLADADVCRFEDSFCELRDWVDASLDIYKPQLRAVLYPLLIHCFLEMVRRDRWKEARSFLIRCAPDLCNSTAEGSSVRRQELLSLQAISSPQHIEENETARLYLSYRYEIYLSYYAFELILSFLADDSRRTVLLRILNQRCRLRFDSSADSPALGSGGLFREDANGKRRPIGLVTEEETTTPQTDVLWGRLHPELYIMSDEVAAEKAKSKAAGEKKGGDKPKADVAKKDMVGDDEEEAIVREDGTISRSRIPLKRYRTGAPGLETAADRKSRAHLRVSDAVDGIRKDLAILFYTFTNTKYDGLNCSAVTEDGGTVAAGFGDSTVRVWDARATGTAGSDAGGLEGHATRLVGHSGPVYGVDWSKCSRFLLSGSEDGMVRLWNVGMKVDLVVYRGHNFPVWDVRFSPLDHYFASASHDRTARIWSTDRVHPLRILAGHLADVDIVQWHPNVNYLATGSSDRTVRLWDVRDGKCVRVMHAAAPVHALAFSPDGKTLASAGDGPVIDVWDIVAGSRVRSLKGHRSSVWCLDYSRDGAVLASGGADWRVCVWRAEEWSTPVDFDDTAAFAAASSKGVGNGGDGLVDLTSSVENPGGAGAAVSADGNSIDADGDVRMDGRDASASKKDSTPAADDAADKQDAKAKAFRAKIASLGMQDEDEWNSVPLVEAFETKETPVQLVKFTRRNLLIAGGSFGT